MRVMMVALLTAGTSWAAAPPTAPEGDIRLVAILGGQRLRHPTASLILLSPDGKLAATVGRDGTRLWETRTGRPRRTLDTGGLRSLHWTTAGRLAGITADGKAAVALDPATGKGARMPLAGRFGGVAVYLDNVGVVSIGYGGNLFDSATGKRTRLDLPGFSPGRPLPHGTALSPDGKWVAYADGLGTARLVEVARPKVAAELFRSRSARSLQVTAGGKHVLALGDNGEYIVHDVAAKRTTRGTLPGLPGSASLSGDGKTIAALSRNGAVLIADAATGKIRLGPDAHHLFVNGVGLHPDGDAFTAGADGRVLRWPAVGVGAITHDTPGECRSLSLSADGRHMAVATVRNGVIVYSGVGLKDRRTPE
jgi:WD40 repeat protein